jgi:hypothetical protein
MLMISFYSRRTKREQVRLLRHTLHAIDAIFCPLSPDDPGSCKAPASVKKMKQGMLSGRIAKSCWVG